MLSFFCLSTTFSAFFLAFLLFSNQNNGNKETRKWASAFLACLSLTFFDAYLNVSGSYQAVPSLIGFLDKLAFAIAPSLHLSVASLVIYGRKKSLFDLIHFVPALLFLVFQLPILFQSGPEKLALLDSDFQSLAFVGNGFKALLYIQIFAYGISCMVKIFKHKALISHFTSQPDLYTLNWLIFWLFCFGFTYFMYNTVYLFKPFFGFHPYVIAPVFTVEIFVFGFFLFRQADIKSIYESPVEKPVSLMHQSSEQWNHLPKSVFELKREELIVLMEKQKPYLHSNFNLPALSSLLGLTPHETSELINKGMKENFSQFINKFRVEESKRMLLSPEYKHLSIIGVGYESGFNSKTVFNTFFKKFTGQTPSEYKKNGELLKPLVPPVNDAFDLKASNN